MGSRILADVATEDREQLGSVVHVIARCNSCNDLIETIQVELLPLLNAEGVFITHFNQQSGETSITGLPVALKKLSSRLVTLTNQVIMEHDPSRYSLSPGMVISQMGEMQVQDKSEDSKVAWPQNFNAIAGFYDIPSPTVGLWIYKKENKVDVFEQREIDILKYLQPIFIQTIKAIIFQKEKQNYSNIAEHFLSSNVPKAVIKSDCSVLISNIKFSEQMNQGRQSVLPKRLQNHVSNLINEQRLLHDQTFFVPSLVLFRFKRRLYEISIIPVECNDVSRNKLWLLTLERTSNADMQLSRSLQGAKLTRRETEITLWLQKGFSCSDVATKLNLSYHTARTHVRNIYKKLDISSYRELVTFVHQNQSGI